MTEIIPALMPKSFSGLEELAGRVRGLVSFVQVDVMDGKMVPPVSWPFPNFTEETAPLLREDRGLPFWDELNYEFDLMIREPEKFVEKFVAIGAARVIIHYESAEKEKIREAVRKVQDMSTEVGLAIDTVTPNEVLDEFLTGEDKIDLVQIMGIAQIGYQGQPFDERVIPKIKALREKYPDIMISVDGGVNFDSAALLIKAGANRLVSGSAILNSENPREAIRNLREF